MAHVAASGRRRRRACGLIGSLNSGIGSPERMPAELDVETTDGVAVVRIDRPPPNAHAPSLPGEGAVLMRELRADPPDALVVTGAAADPTSKKGPDPEVPGQPAPEGSGPEVPGSPERG
jgi:hypothetical protein